MNVIQRSQYIKLAYEKAFKMAVPKWHSADAMDIQSVLMEN